MAGLPILDELHSAAGRKLERQDTGSEQRSIFGDIGISNGQVGLTWSQPCAPVGRTPWSAGVRTTLLLAS